MPEIPQHVARIVGNGTDNARAHFVVQNDTSPAELRDYEIEAEVIAYLAAQIAEEESA